MGKPGAFSAVSVWNRPDSAAAWRCFCMDAQYSKFIPRLSIHDRLPPEKWAVCMKHSFGAIIWEYGVFRKAGVGGISLIRKGMQATLLHTIPDL